MQLKAMVLASAIAILCLAGPIMSFANIDADTYNYVSMDIEAFDVNGISDISYENVISLDEINSDELTESINELDSDNTILASSHILASLSECDTTALKSTMECGVPLVVCGNPYVLQDIGISVIINPNASYSAVYCEPNSKVIYCYGIESSEPIAEDTVMAWVESVRSTTTTELDTDFGDALFYQETKICDGDRGRINATAMYSRLGTSNGYTYYAVQYNCEAIAKDSAWSVADMTVSCDVDANNAFQHLIDYGPDSTETETTTSVSVSMSVDMDTSIGTTVGWSYTVPSTIIHNQCDTSEDYFSIWHDIDENTADNTVRVKPGMIISTNSSIYSATDVYEVIFRGPYYDQFWPWDPETELKIFTLECNALLSV